MYVESRVRHRALARSFRWFFYLPSPDASFDLRYRYIVKRRGPPSRPSVKGYTGVWRTARQTAAFDAAAFPRSRDLSRDARACVRKVVRARRKSAIH